ncbi:hypothetical protein AALP_AA7G131000 [Arabis alpina]|uniref:TMEM205-like domain-containing protein n=1 Tax=Arabis alpina TaxID=50452 RepID=A0A087GHR0_ARAAL|nr:hypothetical protein AALP_AA7G131000 [Arabis alpina]
MRIVEIMIHFLKVNLLKHQFGNLQSKMFPAYFTLVGSCCAILPRISFVICLILANYLYLCSLSIASI